MTLDTLLHSFHARKAYYVSIGWTAADCWIGYFDGMLKLASDFGATTFRDRGDGVIIRDAIGHRSKLIEFMETDVAIDISIHNRTILDAQRKATVAQ